jgi:hypothetical protein
MDNVHTSRPSSSSLHLHQGENPPLMPGFAADLQISGLCRLIEDAYLDAKRRMADSAA